MKMRYFLLSALFCIMSVSAYAADNIRDMISQSTGSFELRVRSFDRDYDTTPAKDRNESAIGGLLRFKSADLHGVSFGVSMYNAGDFYSDDDKGGYDLLTNNDSEKHKGFTKMGEAYLQGNWFDTVFKVGAHEINTPYANKHDSRVAPKSYKGASVVSDIVPNLTMSAYYITDFIDHGDTTFDNIAKSYATGMEDNPLLIGGLKYNLALAENTSVKPQAWYYTIKDGLEMTYFDAEFSTKINDFTFSLLPSYLQQKATGDKTGGDFDTELYGATATVEAYGFNVQVAYAKVGDDDIQTPWGHSLIINQNILGADTAGVKAYAAIVGYDFSKLGADGLDFSVSYAKYESPDSGAKASFDASEVDYEINYKPTYLKGLALRASYGVSDTDGTFKSSDATDTRFLMSYAVKFGEGRK